MRDGVESGPLDVEAAAMRAATLVASLPRDAEIVDFTERRARGLRNLHAIKGLGGRPVVASIRDLAPDLADWLLDFSYGEAKAHPGSDSHIRHLSSVAALTASGRNESGLEVHIKGALDIGCARQEIVEVILQMTACAGLTAVLIALRVTRRVSGAA